MSLIHLLKVGQTLAMGKPRQYRETGLVTRFETVLPEVLRQANDSELVAAQEMTGLATKIEKATAMNTPTNGADKAGTASLWSGLLAWLDRRKAKSRVRAVTGTSGKSPAVVQQELRLQNVKVCRNDLSDADWEVVQPPKSGARLAFIRQLASTGTSASKRNRTAPRTEVVGRI